MVPSEGAKYTLSSVKWKSSFMSLGQKYLRRMLEMERLSQASVTRPPYVMSATDTLSVSHGIVACSSTYILTCVIAALRSEFIQS
jgi:hypothetical protein